MMCTRCWNDNHGMFHTHMQTDHWFSTCASHGSCKSSTPSSASTWFSHEPVELDSTHREPPVWKPIHKKIIVKMQAVKQRSHPIAGLSQQLFYMIVHICNPNVTHASLITWDYYHTPIYCNIAGVHWDSNKQYQQTRWVTDTQRTSKNKSKLQHSQIMMETERGTIQDCKSVSEGWCSSHQSPQGAMSRALI